MKVLVEYNPVAGVFLAIDDATKSVLNAARKSIGEDLWKRGYNAQVAQLVAAGATPPRLQGRLASVYYAENKDQARGNVYRKLRLVIENETDVFTVSLDIESEIAQRLIQLVEKLEPDAVVELSARQESVDRDGKAYVNHVPVLKSGGKEVFPTAGHWKAAQDAANKARDAIRAVVKDPRILNAAAAQAKADYHRELLAQVETRFKAPRPRATPEIAEPTEASDFPI